MNSPPETRKVGPFTWYREDQGTNECWRMVPITSDVKMTGWAVKNYGGTPGPGFAGWKLVSGGPFDGAGAYTNLDDALVGVVPYLVAFIERDIAHGLEKARTLSIALEAAQQTFSGKAPSPCPVPSPVSDEEIQDLFAGTNFGARDYRKLMEQGVLKVWCGFANGYTLTTILQQARLVSVKGNVTDRGRKFAFNAFYNNAHSG